MQHLLQSIDLWLALGVVAAMALSDAVVVMFTSSIISRNGLAVANWSALSYALSSFAVISFTNNWIYVVFAALGSWIGSYLTMKYLHRPHERADQEKASDAALAAPGDLASVSPDRRLAA
jgi:hypothetical protein